LLYEADSMASLVSAVRRVLSEEQLRAVLVRRAREAAEQRGWAFSTQTLRRYYEEALG
jgi:UDP:flavonoid glycosyltransferase YjiC (YdhE family)